MFKSICTIYIYIYMCVYIMRVDLLMNLFLYRNFSVIWKNYRRNGTFEEISPLEHER